MSNRFKVFFIKSLNEDVSVGSALGASGGSAAGGFSGDFYAPGDSRLPSALGAVVAPKRRNKRKKRKSKKKKSKSKKKRSKVKETLKIPIQRRTLPGM